MGPDEQRGINSRQIAMLQQKELAYNLLQWEILKLCTDTGSTVKKADILKVLVKAQGELT